MVGVIVWHIITAAFVLGAFIGSIYVGVHNAPPSPAKPQSTVQIQADTVPLNNADVETNDLIFKK